MYHPPAEMLQENAAAISWLHVRLHGLTTAAAAAGGTFSQMSGLPERPAGPSGLGPALWPQLPLPGAMAPGAPVSALQFQQLTTCSWEQNDVILKVYVPLRGVQTDMLHAIFTPSSAEVSSCCPVRLCESVCNYIPVLCLQRPHLPIKECMSIPIPHDLGPSPHLTS